jgi:hypothetical protein
MGVWWMQRSESFILTKAYYGGFEYVLLAYTVVRILNDVRKLISRRYKDKLWKFHR